MRRRHCLSKEVAGLYILTIFCNTRKDYNNNISTFLRGYNRLGRILEEYRNNHSIPYKTDAAILEIIQHGLVSQANETRTKSARIPHPAKLIKPEHEPESKVDRWR
jgi:hypothetical protein